MKGLLYKEFKMFECQIKTWAAVLVFLSACAVIAGQTGPFIGGMCGFVVISSLSPFTEERRSGSDAYTVALPVSRREIVKARAALLIFVMVAVFLTLGVPAGGLAATEEAIQRGILSALLVPSYLLSESAMEKKEF